MVFLCMYAFVSPILGDDPILDNMVLLFKMCNKMELVRLAMFEWLLKHLVNLSVYVWFRLQVELQGHQQILCHVIENWNWLHE